jgi:stage IV sporulation protein FA
MSTKDNSNQHKEKPIKKWQAPQSSELKAEDFYSETLAPQQHEYFHEEEWEEPDPETVWKSNPNPWASWGEDAGFGGKRSYVKAVDPSNRKDPTQERSRHTLRKEFAWKLLIAALLFGAIYAMFQYDNEYTRTGQAMVKQALVEEIDFAAAASWYKDTFAGAPSFIPIFEDKSEAAIGADGTVKLPIVAPLQEGALVRTFAELLNGIELAGQSEEQVVAAETGRVLDLSEQSDKGSTIVIQHANQRVTVYGLLGKTEVNVNDWVEAGDPIGSLLKSEDTQPSLLYFAVKQNGLYIDPVGVIPLD